jgi:hypothetical protein
MTKATGIELLCSCGKTGCANRIHIGNVDGRMVEVWIDHSNGWEMLIYSSPKRIRTFANKLLRAIHKPQGKW